MWQQITDAVGDEGRDALWAHPDVLPTGEDIDDPAALIARLEARARGEVPEPDDFDTALEDLLRGENGPSKDDTPPVV